MAPPGAGAAPSAETPNRSRMLGVSSDAGAGPLAKGLEAGATALNFSMAAASSFISCWAVLSSILPPLAAALPKALINQDKFSTISLELHF